jgi:hypothetical protein
MQPKLDNDCVDRDADPERDARRIGWAQEALHVRYRALFLLALVILLRAVIALAKTTSEPFSPLRNCASSSAACRSVIQAGELKPFATDSAQRIRMLMPEYAMCL